MTTIRAETPEDRAAVRHVNEAAFGRAAEADLVDRLKADGHVLTSLVADQDGEIVGHILFTRLPVAGFSGEAAALAPMAVRPDRQRSGIGGALIRAGVDTCREFGIDAIVVLGHEHYYPRFGFSVEAARSLDSPFSGPAYMALILQSGVMLTGKVEYPRAFFEVDP